MSCASHGPRCTASAAHPVRVTSRTLRPWVPDQQTWSCVFEASLTGVLSSLGSCQYLGAVRAPQGFTVHRLSQKALQRVRFCDIDSFHGCPRLFPRAHTRGRRAACALLKLRGGAWPTRDSAIPVVSIICSSSAFLGPLASSLAEKTAALRCTNKALRPLRAQGTASRSARMVLLPRGFCLLAMHRGIHQASTVWGSNRVTLRTPASDQRVPVSIPRSP